MKYESHPAARLFPMMDEEGMTDLVKDVSANGLMHPIVMLNGQILDGRNRMIACERAAVEPRFRQWNGEGGTPTNFVISENLHRRHLTTSQRAAIAVEALPQLEAEARERMAEGGRGGLKVASKDAPLPIGRSTHHAAKLFGVGSASVERAKAVKVRAPEVFEQVASGEKSVTAAYNEVVGPTSPRSISAVPRVADESVSPRDVVRGDAHKRKLTKALSAISGACAGLDEIIDMRVLLIALTDDEIKGWLGVIDDASRSLRNLRRTLQNRGGITS